MEHGTGRAMWAAWGLALLGGLSVAAAAVLIVRSDLAAACTRGAACSDGIPSSVTVLTLGGVAIAVVGGLIAVAVVLAVRRASSGRRSLG